MKKQHAAPFLLMLILAAVGCADGDDPGAEATLTPGPTPTPIVTMEPTEPPALASVDPALPSLDEALLFAPDEWPSLCRMRYLHSSGNLVGATGRLARGEGYTVYLLENLSEKSFDHFLLEEDRIAPERSKLLDTGEGIQISLTDESASDALSDAIARSGEDGYHLSARHPMAEWADMYAFSLDADRGVVPYDGEFAILEDADHNVRRILALEAARETRLVTLQVYEPVAEPAMFQYLCSMLASLRFD